MSSRGRLLAVLAHPDDESLVEHRISELEQLTSSQSRELKFQFERIAQMQAEWEILRMRFTKARLLRAT
jgi:hypothetical protein